MAKQNVRYQAVKQGGPLELVEEPRNEPEQDEIVIELKAVALNPADWKRLYDSTVLRL